MEDNLADDETKGEIQRQKDAAISLELPRIVEYLFEEIRFILTGKTSLPKTVSWRLYSQEKF
jgi:hypothetical protein